MLKRSALAVARFESGWNASPASFTSDSVSFDVSATARSNDARANSLCSCRYSVGDLASASERIASAACSTPSRLERRRPGRSSGRPRRRRGRPRRSPRHWRGRGRRAPRRPSGCAWRGPGCARWRRRTCVWNGANAGTASKPLKKLVLVTVSILSWAARAAFGAVLRAAVRVLRVVRRVERRRRPSRRRLRASRGERSWRGSRLATFLLSCDDLLGSVGDASAIFAGASAAAWASNLGFVCHSIIPLELCCSAQ